jgi:hypothetical protein
MAPKCPAITRAGEPCQGYVHEGYEYCPAHRPDRAEARKKAASKAGRSKAGSVLYDLYRKLDNLGDEVAAGRTNRADASVAAQCYGVAVKAYEAWIKHREFEEITLVEHLQLKQEVEELRDYVETQQAASRRHTTWGS